MTRYIGAIDQGTTSTRFIVFDRQGLEELKKNRAVHSRFLPLKDQMWRDRLTRGWEKAVQRTLNWTADHV